MQLIFREVVSNQAWVLDWSWSTLSALVSQDPMCEPMLVPSAEIICCHIHLGMRVGFGVSNRVNAFGRDSRKAGRMRCIRKLLFVSHVIVKFSLKLFTKKSVQYDMNMVTIRALTSDLSVLQHQLHRPTGTSFMNSAGHEGDTDLIACCFST